MSSSSKSPSSPYKNKVEGEVVGLRHVMCVITNKKIDVVGHLL